MAYAIIFTNIDMMGIERTLSDSRIDILVYGKNFSVGIFCKLQKSGF